MDRLWPKALDPLDQGDFSRLELMLGGPDLFVEPSIIWYEKGNFETALEMIAAVFTCVCLLGTATTARYLLDEGVDPLAGIKAGLNGSHYAASGGRLDLIRLLIERKVPMEVAYLYGGTVLGQALWSAVNRIQAATRRRIIEHLSTRVRSSNPALNGRMNKMFVV